jgi:hypothetical protein
MAAGLRTRLLQLRGVVAAFPTIEAPWFLLLLPVDPGLVLPDLPDGLVSAAAVELRGHPGAVRFAVDPEAVPAAIRQYASAVETALRRARGGN